jgi:hypothetical protein
MIINVPLSYFNDNIYADQIHALVTGLVNAGKITKVLNETEDGFIIKSTKNFTEEWLLTLYGLNANNSGVSEGTVTDYSNDVTLGYEGGNIKGPNIWIETTFAKLDTLANTTLEPGDLPVEKLGAYDYDVITNEITTPAVTRFIARTVHTTEAQVTSMSDMTVIEERPDFETEIISVEEETLVEAIYSDVVTPQTQPFAKWSELIHWKSVFQDDNSTKYFVQPQIRTGKVHEQNNSYEWPSFDVITDIAAHFSILGA